MRYTEGYLSQVERDYVATGVTTANGEMNALLKCRTLGAMRARILENACTIEMRMGGFQMADCTDSNTMQKAVYLCNKVVSENPLTFVVSM